LRNEENFKTVKVIDFKTVQHREPISY